MLRKGMKNFRIVEGPYLTAIEQHLFEIGTRKQLDFKSKEGGHNFLYVTGVKRPNSPKKTTWLIEGEIPFCWADNGWKHAVMLVHIQYDIVTRTGKMRVPNGFYRPSGKISVER